MKTRWIGLIGVLFIILPLVLEPVGRRFFPATYWNSSQLGMMNGMMDGNGPMTGMMNGMVGGNGSMAGMMNGMVGGQVLADSNQPFDRRFLDQMIVHHQHGVMMTEHMVADSERAELRDLAQRISSAQRREIEQMQQWRSEWYDATAGSAPQEAMMAQMMSGGMIKRDQMRQIMGDNVDLERMFLQMMIPHHQDAIRMAEQALQQAEHSALKTLTQSITTTQRAEIEEMQRYLKDWYGISR